jgi:hypothetical protein
VELLATVGLVKVPVGNCERSPPKLPCTVGKKLVFCARYNSCAWRRAACAAPTSGLACNACRTNSLSLGDWNSVHHCPGMSIAGDEVLGVAAGALGRGGLALRGRAAVVGGRGRAQGA